MAKKTPIDKLGGEIKLILNEYAEQLEKDLDEATKAVCKKGAQAIKESAREMFGGSGKYASGWTSTIAKKRWKSAGVIYNSKAPGLAHLLEKGHAKQNGGRTQARPHIKPVADELTKEYEEVIRSAITRY